MTEAQGDTVISALSTLQTSIDAQNALLQGLLLNVHALYNCGLCVLALCVVVGVTSLLMKRRGWS